MSWDIILKYLINSAASALIDSGMFFLVKSLFGAVAALGPIPVTFIASFVARVVSSLFNFFVNARVVFGDRVGKKTMLRYYTLAALQIAVSAGAVYLLENILSIASPALSTLIKAVVDTILFFISFRVKHKWVFAEGKN